MFKKKIWIPISIIVPTAIVAICMIQWAMSTNRPFSDDKIIEWEDAVAALSRQKNYVFAMKPNESLANRAAMRIANLSDNPLELWKQLSPLLRTRKPTESQFAEMLEITKNLLVISGMFRVDDAIGNSVEDSLEEMQKLVVKWQYAEKGLR